MILKLGLFLPFPAVYETSQKTAGSCGSQWRRPAQWNCFVVHRSLYLTSLFQASNMEVLGFRVCTRLVLFIVPFDSLHPGLQTENDNNSITLYQCRPAWYSNSNNSRVDFIAHSAYSRAGVLRQSSTRHNRQIHQSFTRLAFQTSVISPLLQLLDRGICKRQETDYHTRRRKSFLVCEWRSHILRRSAVDNILYVRDDFAEAKDGNHIL